jgi:hypothetical protein
MPYTEIDGKKRSNNIPRANSDRLINRSFGQTVGKWLFLRLQPFWQLQSLLFVAVIMHIWGHSNGTAFLPTITA